MFSRWRHFLIVIEEKPIKITLRLGELTRRRQKIPLTSPAPGPQRPFAALVIEALGFQQLGGL